MQKINEVHQTLGERKSVLSKCSLGINAEKCLYAAVINCAKGVDRV